MASTSSLRGQPVTCSLGTLRERGGWLASAPQGAWRTLAGQLDWEILSFSCWTLLIPAVPSFCPLKSHLSGRVGAEQSGLPILGQWLRGSDYLGRDSRERTALSLAGMRVKPLEFKL